MEELTTSGGSDSHAAQPSSSDRCSRVEAKAADRALAAATRMDGPIGVWSVHFVQYALNVDR